MWRLQGNGVIFVCCVSVKLRLVFTAGPYWQVVSARCTVWIFIDLWNLRPRNACSLSFLRPALKICVKNADFCVNANPAHPWLHQPYRDSHESQPQPAVFHPHSPTRHLQVLLLPSYHQDLEPPALSASQCTQHWLLQEWATQRILEGKYVCGSTQRTVWPTQARQRQLRDCGWSSLLRSTPITVFKARCTFLPYMFLLIFTDFMSF